MSPTKIDLSIGGGGVLAMITLSQFNQLLVTAAGLLTVATLSIRFYREWRKPNNPDKPDEN
jgi:hypothetical protein